MRKILVIALAALMAFGSFGAFAEEATLGGVVVETTASTVRIETEEFGEVIVNYDETTEFEGIEGEIAAGSYIIVTYDGIMTRSMPGQIFARKIAMYVISGMVVEAGKAGVLVDRGGDAGLVFAHLAEGMAPLFYGCPVDVYYSGIMAMSYPGQIGALHVVTPTLTGEITEIGDGYFLLTDETGGRYRVANDDGTAFDGRIKVGDSVSAYYDGTQLDTDPARIYGIAVLHNAK